MTIGLFEEFAKNLTGELITKAVNELISRCKTAIDCKQLVHDTCQFFGEYEKSDNQYYDELSKALSAENMAELTKCIKNDSGYTIKNNTKAFLMKMMDRYEIPHDQAVFYSEVICNAIIMQIQTVDPEKYNRILFDDFAKQSGDNQASILKTVEQINNKVDVIRNDSISVYSANEMDRQIKHETDHPRIGISFFSIDDVDFKDEFSRRKNDELLYVRSRCREEAIYCIINELWELNDDRAIMIVRSKEDWDELSRKGSKGNIYIPWFYDDEIIAIQGNTTIFVVTDDMPVFAHKAIELRPRMTRTIIKKLEDAGMGYSEAHSLVKDTHGLYIPMKKRILNGAYLKQPKWVDCLDDKIKKVCLLVGKWTDSDGDKEVIEELSGIPYREFMTIIEPYTKGEDPLIYVINERGSHCYTLASAENTWDYVDISVNDELWEQFIGVFLRVINSQEKLMTCSEVERLSAEMNGEKLHWSSMIRHGMIRSLIMKVCYKKDQECQYILDDLIDTIFDNVKAIDQWIYISNYIVELSEVSPGSVIKRFLREFNESTGLLAIFGEREGQNPFSYKPYNQFLFSIESLLTQKDYALDAMTFLLKLDNLSLSYPSNDPKTIFDKVFCPWADFSVFNTIDDKKNICEKALKADCNAWDHIFEALPDNHHYIVGELTAPQYRDHCSLSSVNTADLRERVNLYIQELIEHLDYKQERITKLLTITINYGEVASGLIIDSIRNCLAELSDPERIAVKEKIREIIHQNRFFKNASWALPEDKIHILLNLLDDIHTDEMEYEYRYLFYNDFDNPLVDPIASDVQNSRVLNQDRFEALIKSELASFKEKHGDLKKLASICSEINNSTLGQKLAEYWSDSFDESVFSLLVEVQQSAEMAVSYYYQCSIKKPVQFDTVLMLAKNADCTDAGIVLLYRAESGISKTMPAIAKADDSIKKRYWRQINIRINDNKDWVMSEIVKYGNTEVYIEKLFEAIKEDGVDKNKAYQYLINSNNCRNGDTILGRTMMQYHLKEILNYMDESFPDDEEKQKQIVKIELRFFTLLDWEDMKCTRRSLVRSPELYAQIVSVAFKKQSEGKEQVSQKTQSEKDIALNFYRLYDEVQFCPAEKKGSVNLDELQEWASSFKEMLVKNGQEYLYGHFMGHLLAYSPVDEDGFSPCVAVRKFIEREDNDEMQSAYVNSVFNSRGVYWGSEGRNEKQLSENYKQNADALSKKYPRTAEIYRRLYKIYRNESESERAEAENVTL